MSRAGLTFDRQAAERVAKATRRLEAQFYNQPPAPAQRRASSNQRARSRIRVRNDSGADREMGDVLAIREPLVKPGSDSTFDSNLTRRDRLARFKRSRPLFKGVTPDVTQDLGKWALLSQPIPNGDTGWAYADGIALCQLDTGGDGIGHPFADIDDATNTLKSNWYGAAEILWDELESGERWAIVRIGNFQAPTYKGKTDGSITAGSSGTVDLFSGGTTDPGDVAESISNVELSWMEGTDDLADNTEVMIQFFRDEQKWRVTGAAC